MAILHRWFCLAVVLFFCCVLSAQSKDRPTIQVDESKLKFHLQPETALEFPMVNTSDSPHNVTLLLEMLGSDNKAVSSKHRLYNLAPNTPMMDRIAWDSQDLSKATPNTYTRLRYTITSDDGKFALTYGIVQLALITQDAFDIRTFGGPYGCSRDCTFWVRVDNTHTGEPFAGVTVDAEVRVFPTKEIIKAEATTDQNGYATIHFNLPNPRVASGGYFNLTAHRGPFQVGFGSSSFSWWKSPRLTLSTDKPLYQPGQTVHMRVLAFGVDKRAWEDTGVTVKIRDRSGQEQFHSTAITSKFGVATADWEVPQKLSLGDYAIEAMIDPTHSRTTATASIRISRYDLPAFTVTASPDRSYYVPGQDEAAIQIHADYLFGRPVQRATVRVVDAYGWSWMYSPKKSAANDIPALAEGELDASGKFIAHLDLKPKFTYLQANKWSRFTDWPLAVYLTDISTGRTEQRRFDLRVSLEPIHFYIAENFARSSSEPAQFYVTSFYADGTPASVNGTIEAARLNVGGKFDENPDPAHRTLLGTFHTNNLGVARVEVNPLKSLDAYPPETTGPYAWYGRPQIRGDLPYPTATKHVQILLKGADAQGLAGSAQEQVILSGSMDYIQVRPDHALYHPGDPVHLKIATNTGIEEALIQIRNQDGKLLATQPTHLHDKHAEVTVPYASEFQGLLRISAYAITDVDEPRPKLVGDATILYPAGQSLKVAMTLPRTTFRPGDTASASFRVTTSGGDPAESALGVLVFDTALAERVRSDQQFGRRYGFSILDYLSVDDRFILHQSMQRGIGGITTADLLALDPRKPFPDGFDLVADALLHTYSPREQQEFWGFSMQLLASWTQPAFAELQRALDGIYTNTGRYPTNEAEFRAELKEAAIDPDSLRDAWDMPYRVIFSDHDGNLVMSLVSNGPDKRPGTKDDFVARYFQWPYYKKIGQEIDQAILAYHAQTRKYIIDYQTLLVEMKKKNIDLDALHDPWGHPYRYKFHIEANQLKLEVDSAGRDGRFSVPSDYSPDDVHEWTSSIQFFREEQTAIESALDQYYAKTGTFPHSDEELKPVLELAKLSPEHLLDPFGKPYQFIFNRYNRYSDRIQMLTYSEYQGPVRKKTEVTPVTQQVVAIQVLTTSTGFYNNVASFTRTEAEQSSKDVKPVSTPQELPRSGETGGLAGTVTTGSGEPVAWATVVAASVRTGRQFTTRTDQKGAYSFSALPVGIYTLDFSAGGFRTAQVTKVPVEQGKATKLDAQLEVLPTSETASTDRLQMGFSQNTVVEVASTSGLIEGQNLTDQGLNSKRLSQEEKPLYTPRVRQYFPETLLWRPEVITDAQGNARIQFPMGDNITAWKMSVVASNLDGEIGVAEKELRTFQPFMIEDDAPKVLTEGDRISLPLVVRNYSDRTQSVTAELQPQSWLSLISAPKQQVSVPAQGDAEPVFTFLARSSIRQGIHHVTARNHETGDTVEQKVSVHPDGEQISVSLAKVLAQDEDSLDVSIPSNAIAGSTDTELRIYPNMTAHVLDALHVVDSGYAWCPEGLASRGYANLLVLQLLKKAGQDNADPGNPRALLAATARKAVQEAYSGLGGMQRRDGSYDYCFSYPKRSAIAPTAYVLHFLNAAASTIEIDRKGINNAAQYLARQQKGSGAWLDYDWKQDKEVEDANVTAFAARALAEAAASSKGSERDEIQKPLPQAMHYLEDHIGSWQDAYLVGNYAIAAATSGRQEYIDRARELLRDLAHTEGATTYWNLEANTSPFCTWGRSGRLETTALAVEALSLLQAKSPNPDTAAEVNRGLQFLLSHKDYQGSWYGTLVTGDVIAAIVAAMPSAPDPNVGSEAVIVVNGHPVTTITLPPGSAVVGPATVELADHLKRGVNRVQIRRSGSASVMNAAAFISYYIPWKDSSSTAEENFRPGESRALRFGVHYDQSSPASGQLVRCEVEAERVGFRGYGVMIAEIGLPPGADVDRESLLAAWPVLKYEVLPDKVLFYLWPIPGGTKFTFQFRLRYSMEAAATPSMLYDYYNPESGATVQPVHFSVHEPTISEHKLTPTTESRRH